MATLIVGLVLFLGMHSVSIVAPAWRNNMAERIGEWPWKGLYGLVSIIGFVLIVWGYGLARQDPTVLYAPPAWLRHITMLLLLPVFVLFFAPYLPGRIKAAAKHPQLVAVKLWAVGHLLANGMLADVVLFGALLAWAVAGRISLKRRVPREVPALPASVVNDVVLVLLGLAVYVGFVGWWHEALIGRAVI